jgi:hypothetical protein
MLGKCGGPARSDARFSKKKEEYFMPLANNERDWGTRAELADAYGLLREFWDTIENSMEGDHPAKERLEAWLSRFEATIAPQNRE